MSYFVKTSELTQEDKQKVSEMTGKIMLMFLEGRSLSYISKQLKLTPKEVNNNVAEILYMFRNTVGRWNYIKMLFRK